MSRESALAKAASDPQEPVTHAAAMSALRAIAVGGFHTTRRGSLTPIVTCNVGPRGYRPAPCQRHVYTSRDLIAGL